MCFHYHSHSLNLLQTAQLKPKKTKQSVESLCETVTFEKRATTVQRDELDRCGG